MKKTDGLKRKLTIGVMSVMAVCLMLLLPIRVNAAEAIVHYGSESYTADVDKTFPLGVYVESEENIGEYRLELTYNAHILQYVDGGTEGGNGTIVVEGNAQAKSSKIMLRFKSLQEGSSFLKVVSATAKQQDSEEELIFENLPMAPIAIGNAGLPVALKNLVVNDVVVESLDVTNFTGAVFIPYSEALDITTSDELDISYETGELKIGVNELVVTARDSQGNESNYTIVVTIMEPEAEASSDVSEESSEAEEIEEVLEESAVSEEDIIAMNKQMEEHRANRNKRAIIILIAMVCLLILVLAATFVVKVVGIGGRRDNDARDTADNFYNRFSEEDDSEEDEEDKDVDFDSLYD